MRARLCVRACVNENYREKECYVDMNDRNNIFDIKSHKKKIQKKAESICGAAPHIGLCMGNTYHGWLYECHMWDPSQITTAFNGGAGNTLQHADLLFVNRSLHCND